MICADCLFTCWQKVKRSYPFFFCPRVELCWKARLTRTSGMALHLVVATQPAKIPTKWPLKSTGIPYKMNGPNPAKFSNCILRLLCDSDFMRKGVNHLFYCSYNMARCRQAPPTKWPPKWALSPFELVHDTKWLGLYGPGGQPFHRGNFSGDNWII